MGADQSAIDGVATAVPAADADGGAGTADDPPPSASATPPASPPRRRYRWLVEWGVIIVVAVVVAVVLRAFVFQTFYVPSTSMYPTLKPGDRIVVDKLDHTNLRPGEIVVFRRPPREAQMCAPPVVPDLVKRVVGLPGQTIEARNDKIYINGKVLPEPWLPTKPTARSTPRTENFGPLTIPQGDYFMMGDNRTKSCDSRFWGPLPASYVVGKVVLRIWPLDRIGVF